jgi:hypothetical protein
MVAFKFHTPFFFIIFFVVQYFIFVELDIVECPCSLEGAVVIQTPDFQQLAAVEVVVLRRSKQDIDGIGENVVLDPAKIVTGPS